MAAAAVQAALPSSLFRGFLLEGLQRWSRRLLQPVHSNPELGASLQLAVLPPDCQRSAQALEHPATQAESLTGPRRSASDSADRQASQHWRTEQAQRAGTCSLSGISPSSRSCEDMQRSLVGVSAVVRGKQPFFQQQAPSSPLAAVKVDWEVNGEARYQHRVAPQSPVPQACSVLWLRSAVQAGRLRPWSERTLPA